MAKQIWKPGNMLYPLPAVMVSGRSIRKIKYYNCGMDRNCMHESGNAIYIRKTRALLLWTVKDSGEFVVNLTTEKIKKATDWCGVRSGRDVDKWKEMHLTEGQASKIRLCTDHRRVSCKH